MTGLRPRAAFVATLVPLFAACLAPDEDRVAPDAPVQLVAAETGALQGHPLADVLDTARETVANTTVTTELVREIAQRSRDAVVSLYVKGSAPYRLRLIPIIGPGVRIDLPGEALGSGFFVHPSGYVLSNAHVVRGGREIRARTSDGTDYRLTVIARDPVYDLALLRVVDPDREFPTLPMGDSAAVDVGEMVLAIGNPLGLGHTVSFGIISQTNRSLSALTDEDKKGREIEFLQTDAAINPGSSGGPLLTLTGAWIGVNTAGILSAQGLSFAVPSSQVREFVGAVLAGNGQRVER